MLCTSFNIILDNFLIPKVLQIIKASARVSIVQRLDRLYVR